MFKKLVLIIVLLGTFIECLNAQNPATVDINSLSDQQIQQIVTEVQVRGLTIEQAAQMAQIQGASPIQIEQLKKRIEDINLNKDQLNEKNMNSADKKTSLENEVIQKNTRNLKYETEEVPEIKKQKKEPSEKAKRIFGNQLFNSENLTFEPPVNIPIPESYVLGINDEIMISIWGTSQKTYQLKVSSNGAINIPDLGPVYVSGMEFSNAKTLIKKRLISIYQGMDGTSPTTYSDVAISNLRSITINVIGEVMTPGTYTLPATASAFNALFLSGGPNENGSFRNIQVIRNNKLVKTIDVYDYLLNTNPDANIPLREQDIIFVPVYEKRVITSGAFKRTGIFELTEHEKLSDLIRYSGGFNEKAYQSQLSLIRMNEKGKKIIDINQSIYDSFLNNNGDSVYASEIINRYENRVNISGAVFRPGSYELTQGLTISELIKKAQGVRENYFGNRGMILRLGPDYAPTTVSFNVDEVLSGKTDITLQREDQVVIQDIFNMREKRTVQIFGEVQNPGEYEFSENMTLEDLIFKSGGFNEAASESFIELARRHTYEQANEMDNELVKLHQFNIDRSLKLNPNDTKFILAPFDYIYVRKAPSYHEQRTVYIYGEVRYPGAYSIGSKKERASDLIKRAGGLMPNAFVSGASMKRISTQAEQNMDVLENSLADSVLTKVESQINNTQLELRLESILKNPGTEFDYLLKDGDQIMIPEISQEVRITGEIRNPIGLAYENGRSLKYYVNRNGGFGEKAKKNKVFIIYSDGTTRVTQNFMWPIYPAVEPGCQIVIPPKPEKVKIDSTGKWLGVASTLTSIVLAISTIAKL